MMINESSTDHNYFAFVERRKANLTKVPIQTTQHEKQP